MLIDYDQIRWRPRPRYLFLRSAKSVPRKKGPIHEARELEYATFCGGPVWGLLCAEWPDIEASRDLVMFM